MANTVKAQFEGTFVDNLRKEKAQATLHAGVFMEGYEVDEYVATFETLIRQAGYEYSTPQTIDKFTEGILFALMEKCMTYDRPTTYEEWKTSLEKRVQLQIRMEASRPELSLRHRRSPSPVPSLEYEDDSEPEEVEEYLEEEEAPPPLPTPWSQQVEAARQEVANPTTWGYHQFHPEAMDTSARGRVRARASGMSPLSSGRTHTACVPQQTYAKS